MITYHRALYCLQKGARLIKTHTLESPQGFVFTLDPGGYVPPEVVSRLIADLVLVPEADALLDNINQTWVLREKANG